jgi:hypothetical protein
MTSDGQEWTEWKAGWQASEADWAQDHTHLPDPQWPTPRLRGYEAEAEHREDWALIERNTRSGL